MYTRYKYVQPKRDNTVKQWQPRWADVLRQRKANPAASRRQIAAATGYSMTQINRIERHPEYIMRLNAAIGSRHNKTAKSI